MRFFKVTLAFTCDPEKKDEGIHCDIMSNCDECLAVAFKNKLEKEAKGTSNLKAIKMHIDELYDLGGQ